MRHLLRALSRQPDPLSDAALLARYAVDRDPAAFEVLVWRHGGMVFGVCRRHLRDEHAAEDAFQATFLVLARKAGGVRGDTLPGWLHRVARRVATRAVVKTRRRRETVLVGEPQSRPPTDGELAAVLDAEIDRLPDRLRQVVVLCYLDGESTEAAAARLGIPRGTVLSRLHTARATLAARLTRRGVTPPAVGLAAVLTAEQVAGGVRAAGGGVGPATALANEVLAMSARKTVLAAAVGLVLAGGTGTGVGVLSAQSGPEKGDGMGRLARQVLVDTPPDDKRLQIPPAPAVQTFLADLDRRIADAEKVEQAASKLAQQVKVTESGIRALESELTRLSSKLNTLQAQFQYPNRATPEEVRAARAKDRAEMLAAHPEYLARAGMAAELWREAVRAESGGRPDQALRQRAVAAEAALAETRDKLTVAFDKEWIRQRDEFDDLLGRLQQEALSVLVREIETVRKKRREAESELLRLNAELQTVSNKPDQLARLQDQRDKIRVEMVLGMIRRDGLADRHDLILAELQELRRLVEAKK